MTGLDVGRDVVGVHLRTRKSDRDPSRQRQDVYLENTVLSTLLLAQNLQSFRLVSGGDHTVGDFPVDDPRSHGIHGVGEGDEVTERRHSVSASGSGIGGSQRGQAVLDISDTKDLSFTLVQGNTDGGTGRGNVLEGCGGRECRSERSGEFLDECPRVERVQEVDVTGRTGQNGDGHFTLFDESLRRLLVRVGTVSERQSLVANTGSGNQVLFGIGRRVHLSEVVCDRLVVGLGAFERLQCQSSLGRVGDGLVLLPFAQDDVVVRGRRNDRDTGMVLGRSSEKGDTSDVDLLNGTGERAVGLLSLQNERVKVADDQGDGRDLVGSQVGQVGFDVPRQDT